MVFFKFPEPLTEGVIISRPNRFIMNVEVLGKVYECHCPSTGRIGSIDFVNIPCLISKLEKRKDRRTNFTVEAISLDLKTNSKKKWIGINQTKVNSYIEFFIRNGNLSEISGNSPTLKREIILGNSRIDFLVNDTYIEVKTFLDTLDVPKHINLIKTVKFNSYKRFIQQYKDLGATKKGKVILCFLYERDILISNILPLYNEELKEAIVLATKTGVETWQVNLSIDKDGVYLVNYLKIV